MLTHLHYWILSVGVCCCAVQTLRGQPATTNAPGAVAVVLERSGTVSVLRAGAKVGDPAYTNQVLLAGDRIETGKESRALLRFSDQSALRVGELTSLEMLRPEAGGSEPAFSLLRGLLYLFHREKGGSYRFKTRSASAGIRGTEFSIEVDENGTTVVTMFDGEVELAGEQGPQIRLSNGQQGTVELGKAAVRTSILVAKNQIIQWCLYYPAVIDIAEIDLTQEQKEALRESLTAYREGALLRALLKYPAGREPSSVAEQVYRLAIGLAVGQAKRVELGNLPPQNKELERVANALNLLVETVQLSSQAAELNPSRHDGPDPFSGLTASECLAISYFEQLVEFKLDDALKAARRAREKSPRFGYAWERVAELEFGFGHGEAAMQALEKSLELSPYNAQAHALRGFVLAAQNKIDQALVSFERAIAIDGSLGNAWLGRGLCKIRKGEAEAGRQDLIAASALEPQRALLRSYLGKAYSNAVDPVRAAKELQLAKTLDLNDPTSWLYSALLNEQGNRVNDAIRDLEKSQSLNKNRRLYRSRFLLDEDRSVRGANLANIYLDDNMTDVSRREAVQAVNADYANYSAHYFLANSYNNLRDPKQVSLRYETPWLTEYLLANLLAPVGAVTLSPTVSQQEYSRLFERDGMGVVSRTDYFSRGDWIQSGAQFGTFGNTSYAVDSVYQSQRGQRPNNDLDQLSLSLRIKQQITPQDSVFLQSTYYRQDAGDLVQYYDPAMANQKLRTKETQEPLLIAGYHHEWSPESHTLILAGLVEDTFDFNNPNQVLLAISKRANGQVDGVGSVLQNSYDFPKASMKYQSEFELVPLEAQHLWHYSDHQIVVGARYQSGRFDTQTSFGQSNLFFLRNNSRPFPGTYSITPEPQAVDANLEHISGYAYDYWQVVQPLRLIAGLSYDRLTAPVNFRSAPITDGVQTINQVSPKAGAIWDISKNTVLRAAYTRSLGGVSFDQSFRLEPTQVAGFNQSFRSLIPESVVGALSGPKFETWGIALDQKFKSGSYVGMEAQLLKSKVSQQIGTFESGARLGSPFQTSSTDEQLGYEEKSLAITMNQLIGDGWSVGARYQLSDARLHDRLPEIPTTVASFADTRIGAILHELNMFALFNDPSGFFAQAESLWMLQSNRGYQAGLPGDDFWQFNVYGGYRFFRRHAEVRLGLLNITDQDYRVNPLNLTTELPRSRTFTASFRFYF